MRAALAAAFCLFAAPALAHGENYGSSASLEQHLTKHGKNIVLRATQVVSIGDISPSSLNEQLRTDCPKARDCFRLSGLSDGEARTGMALLVLEKADDLVNARIKRVEHDRPRDVEIQVQRLQKINATLRYAIEDIRHPGEALNTLDRIDRGGR